MFDVRYVTQSMIQHAPVFVQQHPLLVELAQQMAERLPLIKLQPNNILQTGLLHLESYQYLKQQYPDATLLCTDEYSKLNALFAQVVNKKTWLNRFFKENQQVVDAPASDLPCEPQSIDLIWSNLGLLWQTDPVAVFKAWQRALRPNGWIMFSTLGVSTCQELRLALGDRHQQYLPQFIDMHDVGDMLVNAGLSEPVLDMQSLKLTYQHLAAFWKDLQLLGGNCLVNRPQGLMGKVFWNDVQEKMAKFKNAAGLYEITLELVFGHALKGQAKKTEDGRSIIQLHIPRKPQF